MANYNSQMNEIATKYGAQVVDSCDSATGYPSGVHPVIIGFKSMKEAEQAAKELEAAILAADPESDAMVDTESLMKRDGWHMWYREGSAFEEYNIEDFFNNSVDNYDTFRKSQLEDYKQMRREDREECAKEDDFDAERFDQVTAEVLAEFEKMGDADIIVLYANGEDWVYYETTPAKSMSFYYDTKHFTIGVSVY